jgi:5-methylcytosine-specific restriction endonuclease McrA
MTRAAGNKLRTWKIDWLLVSAGPCLADILFYLDKMVEEMAPHHSRTPEEVLVLNFNYQPLNITSARRAILLICGGKAHTIETDSRTFHSERHQIEMPTVVRLNSYVRRPLPELRASRKSILARDRYTCQYCGSSNVTLTLDHVVPREKGGGSDWDNLVCCCTKCNNIKGNRTPEEVGLKLAHPPHKPKYIPYINYTRFLTAVRNPIWYPYLAPYSNGSSLPIVDKAEPLEKVIQARIETRRAQRVNKTVPSTRPPIMQRQLAS